MPTLLGEEVMLSLVDRKIVQEVEIGDVRADNPQLCGLIIEPIHVKRHSWTD